MAKIELHPQKSGHGFGRTHHHPLPKDTLDIIVFGNDAWQNQLSDLPYLQVGPYHTNTVAGLELAIDILKKKKSANKHIMMITDGKPTCIKKGKNITKIAGDWIAPL